MTATLPNAIEAIAKPFLNRIEDRFDELDSLRGEYMNSCKAVREDIKEIYGEAKDKGVAVKALKGLVRYRQLERKQAAIAAGFDDLDEAADFDALVDQLGDLGIAAARRAGHPAGDGGVAANQ